jgi:hypothetical protein
MEMKDKSGYKVNVVDFFSKKIIDLVYWFVACVGTRYLLHYINVIVHSSWRGVFKLHPLYFIVL